ncbi:LuxR C-terminal-related transcriptional regulator [Oerskovia jenensis]|uniref:LuxR C-terminal-related transcriptional regulator n=1 Tax=Oerskovia jenensis TaxID=162169 RepID=UPI0036DDF2A8
MPASQQDVLTSDQVRTSRTSTEHGPERLSSRRAEIDLALAAVADRRGAFVWTGEPGMGASTTLELVHEALHAAGGPHPPLVLRVAQAVGPQRSGGAVRSLVSQVAQVTGCPVPERLVRPLDVADPEYGYLPEVGAVALAEYLEEAVPDRTVVLLADDLHLVDEISRAVVVGLVAQRRAALVLLATAVPGGFDRPLPYPIEVRELAPLGPSEALHLLLVEERMAVAPHVASRLAQNLAGNAAAISQTARLLTAEQLAGTAILPDPLPPVPAVRTLLGDRLDDLAPEERRALLVAAVAVVERTDVLLAASGLSIEEVLDGPLSGQLSLVSGRFAFTDPRVRSLVHGDARLADRTAAHLRLATVHTAAGEEDIATWHTALATLAGDPALAPGLVSLAQRLLERGDVVWAHEVAREAASQAAATERGEAYVLAGTAALQSGHVHDAADWLRRAARCEGGVSSARILGPLVTALTHVQGQVPDDVLAPFLALADTDESCTCCVDREGRPRDAAGGCEIGDVVRGLTSAARLHAERGDGVAASQAFDAAKRLARRCTQGVGGLDVTRSWLANYGVGERGKRADLPGSRLSPEQEAYAQVSRAIALADEDALDVAGQALASAVANLAPVRNGGRWFDAPSGAVTPYVEAHLRLAQVLVHFWSGNITKARRELEEAAFRLPVGLPFAGTGVAVARRLDMAVHGSVGTVATALEETCSCPTSRPVRLGLLVDRAIGASFARHHTQAATLLELAAETDRRDCAHMLHLPGMDDVEAWVLAGRPDAAEKALARRRVEAKDLSPANRVATLARAEIALARPEDAVALRDAVASAGRGIASPFEHGRTELCLGRALTRWGDLPAAHEHLLSAVELLTQSGAWAWARQAQGELAGVLEHLGALQVAARRAETSPVPTTTPGGGVPHAGAASSGRARLAARESDVSDDALDELRARWADELTDRELDVALLVVQGGSNREAADQLYLSVRTVEVHLGRVFRKLGVRSRVELAVLAHRVGR